MRPWQTMHSWRLTTGIIPASTALGGALGRASPMCQALITTNPAGWCMLPNLWQPCGICTTQLVRPLPCNRAEHMMRSSGAFLDTSATSCCWTRIASTGSISLDVNHVCAMSVSAPETFQVCCPFILQGAEGHHGNRPYGIQTLYCIPCVSVYGATQGPSGQMRHWRHWRWPTAQAWRA